MGVVLLKAARHLSVGLFAIWAVVAGAQQPTQAQLQAEVARMLENYVRDEELLERTVDETYGPKLAAPKRAVTKAMLRTTMGHPAMPVYVANVMAPLMRTTISPADRRTIVFEAMQALQVKGVRRLSTKRQAEFLQYIIDAAASMPASICKALFQGTLDSKKAVAVERAYIASLPLGAFEAATSLYQEAALAELAGYPDARIVSAAQAKAAEKAYEGVVAARIKTMPPGLNAKVASNPAAAEPSAACTWYYEVVGAAFDLPEPFLGWHLTRFVEGMQ